MDNEKELTEVTEETVETAEETVEETVEEAAVEETIEEPEVAEEVVEEEPEAVAEEPEAAEEVVAEEPVAAVEPAAPAMKASTAAKREKKAARRDEKAARKAANKIEEKKSRPNNILLAIMIFGVLIIMFAAVKGYNYFSMDASIEKYIENNGGEESFGSMAIDQYTTANVTAEGNSLKIVLDTTADDEIVDSLKEYYGGDDWEKQMKYIGAYFLTSMKENTQGFSGDVTVTSNVNGEEVKSVSMTLKEAKKELEEQTEEAQEAAEEEAGDDAADDAAEDDAAEDAAEEEAED